MIALLSDVDDAQAAPVRAVEVPPEPAADCPPASPPRIPPAEPIDVSPLAARIAGAKGIDLSAVAGTGPNGRIVRRDLGLASLLTIPADRSAAAYAPALVVAPPPAGVPVETIGLSAMRRTIARRQSESKQTIPHFYLTARCNLDPLLQVRARLNETLAGRGVKLSVNDLLIKALAHALDLVPDANVQLGGDVLHRFRRVDVSMAIATEQGLVTPVIRDVGSLSVSAIANLSKALAAKARDGKLAPEDYEGGTVSLSNLGPFGIDEMIPIINPPQALILGTAAGIAQPWKVGGGIELATIMAVTAGFDHRAIDGSTGASFMQAFRELVENPLRLIV